MNTPFTTGTTLTPSGQGIQFALARDDDAYLVLWGRVGSQEWEFDEGDEPVVKLPFRPNVNNWDAVNNAVTSQLMGM